MAASSADASQLLRVARQAVADSSSGLDDDLVQAALYLITCAADVVDLLPDADVDAARQALGSARAAVTTATCVVHRVHDNAARSSRS